MHILIALALTASHPQSSVQMDATMEDFCLAGEYAAIITYEGDRIACPEEEIPERCRRRYGVPLTVIGAG